LPAAFSGPILAATVFDIVRRPGVRGPGPDDPDASDCIFRSPDHPDEADEVDEVDGVFPVHFA